MSDFGENQAKALEYYRSRVSGFLDGVENLDGAEALELAVHLVSTSVSEARTALRKLPDSPAPEGVKLSRLVEIPSLIEGAQQFLDRARASITSGNPGKAAAYLALAAAHACTAGVKANSWEFVRRSTKSIAAAKKKDPLVTKIWDAVMASGSRLTMEELREAFGKAGGGKSRDDSIATEFRRRGGKVLRRKQRP